VLNFEILIKARLCILGKITVNKTHEMNVKDCGRIVKNVIKE
jgi:hypothetical protein